jgi:hypothetical protein
MLKETVFAFINDEALSRGAAIAFYTVTSIAACFAHCDCRRRTRVRPGGRSKRHHRPIERPHGPANRRGHTNRDRERCEHADFSARGRVHEDLCRASLTAASKKWNRHDRGRGRQSLARAAADVGRGAVDCTAAPAVAVALLANGMGNTITASGPSAASSYQADEC